MRVKWKAWRIGRRDAVVRFIPGVIPAKAGTQWDVAALVEVEGSHWVPAFAGMTPVVGR